VTVVWLSTALRQLAQFLIEFEEYANKQAADALQTKIDKKTKLLETHPELYGAGFVAGTHELVVTANVVLVYRVKPRKKTVEIVRVLKPRMKRATATTK
jgi:plasmid stabilization system protein ParE